MSAALDDESDDDNLVQLLRNERPRTRGDCQDGPRPCPWVSCRHHLYLTVGKVSVRDGVPHLTLNFGDVEVDTLKDTCALDVADRGEASFEEIATAMGITRQRVHQILEENALPTMKEKWNANEKGD